MSDRPTISLEQLATKLKQSLGIIQKQDIQIAGQVLGLQNSKIQVGDDCAAIPDGDGYLLLAAEGIWHVLVETDPWFAGWCAVMVNISDIAAMGGKAIAVVDTIWTNDDDTKAIPLLEGMKAASEAYNVPIVGGHTNFHSAYNALSVAILGRTHKLISSFAAQPGDLLVVAVDLEGEMHPKFPFWNAATKSQPNRLQNNLDILPYLANRDLCSAGKDISMGGIVGTLLMLIEASKCGAVLDLDSIIYPKNVNLETWLLCFPSYGFLLSILPKNLAEVRQQFQNRNISYSVVGEISEGSQLRLKMKQQDWVFWNLETDKFILN